MLPRIRPRVFAISIAALAVSAVIAPAQRAPYTSPPAKSTATINGKEFSVDYYSPGMHGRKIFGELVPFGELWGTGANVATGFTTPFDIRIGDLKLPKGAYSIWTLPQEKEWTLVLNKQHGQFHLDYDQSEDFGRTKMTLRALSEPVENLKIEVKADGAKRGRLVVSWETTEASIPFEILP